MIRLVGIVMAAVASGLACNALLAVDGYRSCNGSECVSDARADTSGDPCLGGPSINGVCQPSVLIGGVGSVNGLVSDGTNLYFGNDTSVSFCSIVDCPGFKAPLAQVSATVTSSLSLDPTMHLLRFGAADGKLYKVAAQGVKATPTSFTSTPGSPTSIIACGDHTCWIEKPQNGSPSAYTCLTSECAPEKLFDFGGSDLATALASDGMSVFAAASVPFEGGIFEALVTCPIAGCNNAPTPMGFDLNVRGIAYYDGFVYWTTNSNQQTGDLARCAPPGCQFPQILQTNLTAPGDIAVDATGVYWTSSANPGRVQMCPPGSCKDSLVTIATKQPSARLTTLDDARIYWVVPDNGANDIMWVAKPR